MVAQTIQSEWIFLQCVTWDTGDEFAGVDNMIRETFLPHISFGKTKHLSPIVGSISTMLVKKSGLVLINPVTPEKGKYLSSQRGSAKLVRAMTGTGAF